MIDDIYLKQFREVIYIIKATTKFSVHINTELTISILHSNLYLKKSKNPAHLSCGVENEAFRALPLCVCEQSIIFFVLNAQT